MTGAPKRTPGSAPTIYDVARECGLAASTVSRAFSRPGRVSAATSVRIREAAERIGYRTNPIARALGSGRTAMLALVVSDITNPVYFQILRGAGEEATAARLTMLLADAQESARGERAAVDRVLPMVDGVVLAGSRMSDAAIRTIASRTALVILNRAVPGVASIVTDNARGMRQAVTHLADLGHTSIAYVAGPEASWADGTRWRAVHMTAQELGLAAHRIGPYPPTVRGGAGAVDAVLREPVTGVVTYNDLLAIGLLRGLVRAGIGVPEQLSVVGFDNIFGSDFCLPALTTVAAPLSTLGSAGVRQLVAQTQGSAPSTTKPGVLPAQLMVRESTGPPGRRPAARR